MWESCLLRERMFCFQFSQPNQKATRRGHGKELRSQSQHNSLHPLIPSAVVSRKGRICLDCASTEDTEMNRRHPYLQVAHHPRSRWMNRHPNHTTLKAGNVTGSARGLFGTEPHPQVGWEQEGGDCFLEEPLAESWGRGVDIGLTNAQGKNILELELPSNMVATGLMCHWGLETWPVWTEMCCKV